MFQVSPRPKRVTLDSCPVISDCVKLGRTASRVCSRPHRSFRSPPLRWNERDFVAAAQTRVRATLACFGRGASCGRLFCLLVPPSWQLASNHHAWTSRKRCSGQLEAVPHGPFRMRAHRTDCMQCPACGRLCPQKEQAGFVEIVAAARAPRRTRHPQDVLQVDANEVFFLLPLDRSPPCSVETPLGTAGSHGRALHEVPEKSLRRQGPVHPASTPRFPWLPRSVGTYCSRRETSLKNVGHGRHSAVCLNTPSNDTRLDAAKHVGTQARGTPLP